ncbi:hypothetical protein LINPERHAP1_LOCUS35679 [Linum perenne]
MLLKGKRVIMWTIRSTSTLRRLLPVRETSTNIVAWSQLRVFVTTSPVSYSSKSELEDIDGKDKESRKNFKERLSDVKTAAKFVKDVANSETESVKEAAETVKDGVNDVKKTTKFVRTIASSTADTVKKLAKEATDKVSNSAIQATTEIVKDKVTKKFK